MLVVVEGRGGREGELRVVGVDEVEPAVTDGGGDGRERGGSGQEVDLAREVVDGLGHGHGNDAWTMRYVMR
jgi:hypothetical protein